MVFSCQSPIYYPHYDAEVLDYNSIVMAEEIDFKLFYKIATLEEDRAYYQFFT